MKRYKVLLYEKKRKKKLLFPGVNKQLLLTGAYFEIPAEVFC